MLHKFIISSSTSASSFVLDVLFTCGKRWVIPRILIRISPLKLPFVSVPFIIKLPPVPWYLFQ